MKPTQRRNRVILIVWRILCGLAITSGLVAVLGILDDLPTAWLAVAVVPGLIVTLLVTVAGYADYLRRYEGR